MSLDPVQNRLERVGDDLDWLIRHVSSGTAGTDGARRVLSKTKAFEARLAVLEADSARLVAKAERHGDNGAAVLAEAAGLSRREAAAQVKTVEALDALPQAREALASGDLSIANAKTLTRMSETAGAAAVEGDGELLAKAASQSPERFAQEAKRWAAQRSDDEGEGRYRCQRARRRLRMWQGDDGMFNLRGELDPVSGAKLQTKLLKQAEQLRRFDLNNPHGEQRSFDQRLADALDVLTSNSTSTGSSSGGDKASAEISIVQHLTPEGDKAFAEISGGDTIPPSVLEQHFCNSPIVGVVYSSKGVPLWRGTTQPGPTKTQIETVVQRYGTCAGCGAHAEGCQTHHIIPRSQGGPHNVDNLMLLCWSCHDKVHHHGWQVVPNGDLHTIKPPDTLRHGPARAPDPPNGHDPPRNRQRRRGPPARAPAAPAPAEPEPLFTTG